MVQYYSEHDRKVPTTPNRYKRKGLLNLIGYRLEREQKHGYV